VREGSLEIHLQLFSILREKLPSEAKGRTVLQLEEGTTLAGLLEELNIKRRVVFSVNGVHITDGTHPLSHGDSVKIFSSVGGG
jgi:thiamine biosynthesis protein ThiS